MFTTTGVTQRIARVRLQLLSNQSSEEFELEFDLEVCTGMGVAGIPQIPREYRGYGNGSCRDRAGTEFVFFAGNLADYKSYGASVRILGKLSCEMSYVAAKCVVDLLDQCIMVLLRKNDVPTLVNCSQLTCYQQCSRLRHTGQ